MSLDIPAPSLIIEKTKSFHPDLPSPKYRRDEKLTAYAFDPTGEDVPTILNHIANVS